MIHLKWLNTINKIFQVIVLIATAVLKLKIYKLILRHHAQEISEHNS